MKTAQPFHLYVLDAEGVSGLAATGLQAEQLTDPAHVEHPALVLVKPGQKAPEHIAARTVVWGAGVATSPLAARLALPRCLLQVLRSYS